MEVQVKCVVSVYLSKDKPTKFPITIFHPSGSCFTNQTITVKRGSTIFFSGILTLIENKLYLELHNFNFIHTYQNLSLTSTKHMPWSKNLTSNNNSTTIIIQAIHNSKKLTTSDNLSATVIQAIRNSKKLTTLTSDDSSTTVIQAIRNSKKSTTPTSDDSSTTITQATCNSKKLTTLNGPSVTITQATLNDHILTPTKSLIQIVRKNPLTPVSTNKRKTRSSHQINNKV